MDQFCQRLGGISLAMQGIDYESAHIAELQRRKYDFLYARSGLTDCIKRMYQRVRGTDFVVR